MSYIIANLTNKRKKKIIQTHIQIVCLPLGISLVVVVCRCFLLTTINKFKLDNICGYDARKYVSHNVDGGELDYR